MVGQGQAHIRQKTTRQNVHFLLGCELNRVAQSFVGFASIVSGNHFDLAAQQAALGVDFFDRQLPALPIGLGELGHGRVTVDFTNLDGCLGHNGGSSGGEQQTDGNEAVHGRFQG